MVSFTALKVWTTNLVAVLETALTFGITRPQLLICSLVLPAHCVRLHSASVSTTRVPCIFANFCPTGKNEADSQRRTGKWDRLSMPIWIGSCPAIEFGW